MTNRALVIAALAPGSSRLRRPLISRDSSLMATGLAQLGASIQLDEGDLFVSGCAPPLASADCAIDVGLAGTAARFLPPVAALATGRVAFDGDPRMRERPMRPLIAALRELGVQIDDDGRGSLPLTVRATGAVEGGSVTVDAAQSSQLVSGLLLAAPWYRRGVDVSTSGDVPSLPHIEMTVAMMRRAGAVVEDGEHSWAVRPGGYTAADVEIEPDATNASYFFAAAALTAGEVTVAGWPSESVQPTRQLLEVLQTMGVEFSYDDRGITARGPATLRAVDADLHEIGEAAPTIAALAAVADGTSTIRGIAHLRLHETDRLHALATELERLGAGVTQTDDGLVIRPRRLRAATWHTYADHRMAMSGAVLGLVVPGLLVEDIGCTSKTMPDFPDRWAALVRSE
jgi:3-phosphoshikimate 1-carboxyvinyltransferase